MRAEANGGGLRAIDRAETTACGKNVQCQLKKPATQKTFTQAPQAVPGEKAVLQVSEKPIIQGQISQVSNGVCVEKPTSHEQVALVPTEVHVEKPAIHEQEREWVAHVPVTSAVGQPIVQKQATRVPTAKESEIVHVAVHAVEDETHGGWGREHNSG